MEEGGCWCTVVEGIKAEAEATSFIVQLLSELYKATILVAALACGGGCAAGHGDYPPLAKSLLCRGPHER